MTFCTRCKKRASFGKSETKIALYCKRHSPPEYVDVKNKTCTYVNCSKQPVFGKSGTKIAVYCKRHAPAEYIDVRHKTCTYVNCLKIPTFGKLGMKIALYCKEHSPAEYVDVVSKTCTYVNCSKQPNFGKLGAKIAVYCKEHAPYEYVDVKNKICTYINCSKQPVFGKLGTKIALYCKRHAPSEYVNVVSKTCSYVNCLKRPNYNFLGFAKAYCATHKKTGMVQNSKKRCVECKRFATSIESGKPVCEDHRTVNSLSLGNCCSVCFAVFVETTGSVCEGCQKYEENGKTVKRKAKEEALYLFLQEEKFPIEQYDKAVAGGCSQLRPDFLITTEWGAIVIECDEHQHNRKTYTCECEITRMKRIYFDIGVEKLLYIRYNPDGYVPSYGDEFPESRRMNFLEKVLRDYMKRAPVACCSVLYLFYDGFSQLEQTEEELMPYVDE